MTNNLRLIDNERKMNEKQWGNCSFSIVTMYVGWRDDEGNNDEHWRVKGEGWTVGEGKGEHWRVKGIKVNVDEWREEWALDEGTEGWALGEGKGERGVKGRRVSIGLVGFKVIGFTEWEERCYKGETVYKGKLRVIGEKMHVCVCLSPLVHTCTPLTHLSLPVITPHAHQNTSSSTFSASSFSSSIFSTSS